MWQGLSVMPHAVKACEQFPTYQDGITPEPSMIVNNEIINNLSHCCKERKLWRVLKICKNVMDDSGSLKGIKELISSVV